MLNKIASLLLIVIATGCGHLEPGGVYRPDAPVPAGAVAGDAVLYRLDSGYRLANEALDAFFLWEHENRADLRRVDSGWASELKDAADRMREAAWQARQEYIHHRSLYLTAPAPALKANALDQLDAWLNKLETVARSVQAWHGKEAP